MREGPAILTAAVALAVAGGAGAASPPLQTGPDTGSLSASLSSSKPRVRPVALTLKLRTELICGQPRSPVVITFPAAMPIPRAFAREAVLVDSRPAASATVASHRVTVTAVRPGGAVCDVIGPGLVTILFTKSARLGNPASPGVYTISVRHGGSTYRTTVHISA